MSADMKRELVRLEWEKEAQEALNTPAGPVHYSNVRNNGKSWQSVACCRRRSCMLLFVTYLH